MEQTGAANRRLLARQNCIAAAEAQLDSLAATGRPLPKGQAAELWPAVTFTIQREAGEGRWKGMDLLTVTAAAEVDPVADAGAAAPVRVRLTRYVRRQPR